LQEQIKAYKERPKKSDLNLRNNKQQRKTYVPGKLALILATNKSKLEGIDYGYGSRKNNSRYKNDLRNVKRDTNQFEVLYNNVINNNNKKKKFTAFDEENETEERISKRKRKIITDDDDGVFDESSLSSNFVNKSEKKTTDKQQNLNQKKAFVKGIEKLDSKNNVNDFITKKKVGFIKKLNFKIIDNSKNTEITNFEFNSVLDKDLTTMELISEMLRKTNNLNIDQQNIKLIKFNKVGIFMSIVPDSENIKNLLMECHDKKIFLVFYLFEQNEILNYEMNIGDEEKKKIIIIHVVKELPERLTPYNFTEDQKFIFPIIKFDTENESKMKSTFQVCIYEALKRVAVLKYSIELRDKSKKTFLI
jgi:hypothetical protein